MSTLDTAVSAGASALVGRADAHRSRGLEPGQRRVDARRRRPAVPPPRRGAADRPRCRTSTARSAAPAPPASRSRRSSRTGAGPPPLRAVASRRRQGRLRRAAQRRPGRGDGRHARRRARLPGQPHGHRPHSRPGAAGARTRTRVVTHDHRRTQGDGIPTGLPKRRRRRRPRRRRTAPASPTRSAASSTAVESTESQANTAVSGMLDGTTDVHDAMIALQRADLTLQFPCRSATSWCRPTRKSCGCRSRRRVPRSADIDPFAVALVPCRISSSALRKLTAALNAAAADHARPRLRRRGGAGRRLVAGT